VKTDCTYVVDENLTQFLGWKGDESTSWWKTEQKKCPYWRSPDGTVYRSERDCFRAKYQHDLPREEDLHEQLSSPTNSELEAALGDDFAENGGRLGEAEAALQKACGF